MAPQKMQGTTKDIKLNVGKDEQANATVKQADVNFNTKPTTKDVNDDAFCPVVTDSTPQEFETRVAVIRKTPEMKTVEKTTMVSKLSEDTKEVSFPRTKIIEETKTATITKPVVKEVKKTRMIDSYRVVEEEKVITETVEVVEEVREKKVEKVAKVIYEDVVTYVTKPVIKKVEKKKNIMVPRVITEKRTETYTDYQTDEIAEKQVEKVPKVITEQVRKKMTIPVVKEVPVTTTVQVPTGKMCETIVSEKDAPAALGPTVLASGVQPDPTKNATAEEKKGLFGRILR